jgi:hypothetical protein
MPRKKEKNISTQAMEWEGNKMDEDKEKKQLR